MSHRGDEIVVVGGGDHAVTAVTRVLARAGVLAHQLRVEQASLDDAFVALTRAPTPQSRATTGAAMTT